MLHRLLTVQSMKRFPSKKNNRRKDVDGCAKSKKGGDAYMQPIAFDLLAREEAALLLLLTLSEKDV